MGLLHLLPTECSKQNETEDLNVPKALSDPVHAQKIIKQLTKQINPYNNL